MVALLPQITVTDYKEIIQYHPIQMARFRVLRIIFTFPPSLLDSTNIKISSFLTFFFHARLTVQHTYIHFQLHMYPWYDTERVRTTSRFLNSPPHVRRHRSIIIYSEKKRPYKYCWFH